MKICIDAGHGSNTAGKRTPKFPDGSFMKEFEFNSRVAEYLRQELEKYENVNLVFTHDHPSGATDVPLRDRTNRANKVKADLFISIHADAYGDGKSFNSASGTTTFIHNTVPQKTIDIANAIHKDLIKGIGRRDRGVKRENFHLLRETSMSAILIEYAFMTNLEEAKLLRSDDFRRRCARVTAEAIAKYFKLKKLKETISSKELYRVQVGAFVKKENAENLARELRQKGYDVFIKKQ